MTQHFTVTTITQLGLAGRSRTFVTALLGTDLATDMLELMLVDAHPNEHLLRHAAQVSASHLNEGGCWSIGLGPTPVTPASGVRALTYGGSV